jgi:hypothetical protein
MTEDEQIRACDALIAWCQNQDLMPVDMVPILAKVMVVACISKGKETDQRRGNLNASVDEVKAASRLVLETFEQLLKD